MIVLRKMRDWLRKHLSLFHQRPSNGERAIKQIEPILQEMRENNNRVRNAVDQMVEETEIGEGIMANDNVINNTRT